MRAMLIVLAAILLTATTAHARRHQAQEPIWQYAPIYQPDWQPQLRQRIVKRHKGGSTKRRASNCRGDCKRPPSNLVTVSTAAGITITVNPSFAPKITAFIQDLVATGYTPKSIHCHASHGHVRGSRHYAGAACDFDQTGWGRTAKAMYHVASLAKQHGLRDGGSFSDYGHIDDGQRLSRVVGNYRHRTTGQPRYAMRPRQYGPAYATALPPASW